MHPEVAITVYGYAPLDPTAAESSDCDFCVGDELGFQALEVSMFRSLVFGCSA